MPRIFAIFALSALVGGCAHNEPTALAWHFLETPEEGAKLAYGAPQSDEVALMLTCAPGSGRVVLSMAAARPVNAIRLGDDRFTATSEADAMGGYIAEAQAGAAAPSLAAFARTGELKLVDSGRRIDLTAGSGERAGVERFFETCEA